MPRSVRQGVFGDIFKFGTSYWYIVALCNFVMRNGLADLRHRFSGTASYDVVLYSWGSIYRSGFFQKGKRLPHVGAVPDANHLPNHVKKGKSPATMRRAPYPSSDMPHDVRIPEKDHGGGSGDQRYLFISGAIRCGGRGQRLFPGRSLHPRPEIVSVGDRCLLFAQPPLCDSGTGIGRRTDAARGNLLTRLRALTYTFPSRSTATSSSPALRPTESGTIKIGDHLSPT